MAVAHLFSAGKGEEVGVYFGGSIAARGVEEAFVEIAVGRKINMLFISVKNSCSTLKSGKTRKLATTKSGDHGYGMEIINKIAEKYNGEFALTAENGVASASVMLEIKQ